MQIVGIDCAAQSKNVGLAYSHGHRVLGVVAGVADPVSQVIEWVDWTRPVLVAMDAPLGWPAPMAEELAFHLPGEPVRTEPNDFFRRRTDRRVHTVLGKLPLDVGSDRIARAAHGALRLLAELRAESGCALPILWEPSHTASGVVEVYPAGTLKAHGLPFAGYKSTNPKQAAVRSELVRQLSELLSLPDDPILEANADALDAVVCVGSALDFLDGVCIEPGEDREIARKEGWIWVKDPERL